MQLESSRVVCCEISFDLEAQATNDSELSENVFHGIGTGIKYIIVTNIHSVKRSARGIEAKPSAAITCTSSAGYGTVCHSDKHC